MIYAVISIILLMADQVTKYETVKNISANSEISIIKNVLSLTHVQNTGAAWGIFSNSGWFLTGLIAVLIVCITWYVIKNPYNSKLYRLSICFVLAGAVGNFTDRILRGGVVDMIMVKFINFPVFNFADCCVVSGAALLCVYIMFFHDKEKMNG